MIPLLLISLLAADKVPVHLYGKTNAKPSYEEVPDCGGAAALAWDGGAKNFQCVSTGGGSGGVTVFDERADAGSANVLDCVGDGITCTVDAGFGRISVTTSEPSPYSGTNYVYQSCSVSYTGTPYTLTDYNTTCGTATGGSVTAGFETYGGRMRAYARRSMTTTASFTHHSPFSGSTFANLPRATEWVRPSSTSDMAVAFGISSGAAAYNCTTQLYANKNAIEFVLDSGTGATWLLCTVNLSGYVCADTLVTASTSAMTHLEIRIDAVDSSGVITDIYAAINGTEVSAYPSLATYVPAAATSPSVFLCGDIPSNTGTQTLDFSGPTYGILP